jgi:hypothetical protein
MVLITMVLSFILIELHPAHSAKFPRLGFAFFGRREMVMLLILRTLSDLVFG